jgi:hypothetical protein
VLTATEDVVRLLRALKGVLANTQVLEEERLIAVVVKYLITCYCYCSMDPNFSLG